MQRYSAVLMAAEYLAEFRTDVENCVSLDAVKACIVPGMHERQPLRQWRYHAFVDPSGGSNDSMTLAIAHKEGNTIVLDMVRERRAPFNPESVVEEFVGELKRYRIATVVGDRFVHLQPSPAGGFRWPIGTGVREGLSGRFLRHPRRSVPRLR